MSQLFLYVKNLERMTTTTVCTKCTVIIFTTNLSARKTRAPGHLSDTSMNQYAVPLCGRRFNAALCKMAVEDFSC